MRCLLTILPIVSIGLATPAFPEDAASAAKQACENYTTLAATGDAAKLVNGFYSEKAIFIGPAPVAGILIGRMPLRRTMPQPSRLLSLFQANAKTLWH
jgi:hypothetical protein